MSTDNIHGDSLLSSISNISVKIDHTEIDDAGFFRYMCNKSIQQHSMNGQVPIDFIDDNQEIQQGSLLQRVYFKYKPQYNGHQQHQQPDSWVATRDVHGLSEEESDEDIKEVSIEQEIKKETSIEQQEPEKPPKTIRKPSECPSLSPQTRNLLQLQKRLKNQTKNIPKNYGKAIITFIQKYQNKVRQILKKQSIQYEQFLNELKEKKKVINTIADLRSMWVDYKYAKCMRLLSNLFLRKYSLSYIFNSRICNYSSHIKYRYRLSEAIKEPYAFKHIKDY